MSLKSRIEALRLGIERIPSGDKYKELIGKGSIFSTRLDTNETARKMVMAPDKSTVSIKVNCNLDSIQLKSMEASIKAIW